MFENDVKAEGTKRINALIQQNLVFENDVKAKGTKRPGGAEKPRT